MTDQLLYIVGSGYPDREAMFNSGLNQLGIIEACIQGNHVLDYGAGLGRLSIPLSKRKYEVTAYDANPEMQKELAFHGLNVITEIEGSYDTCLCFYVLQHQTLEECRVITEDLSRRVDRLIFTVPITTMWINNDYPSGYVPIDKKKSLPLWLKSNESFVIEPGRIQDLFEGSLFDTSSLERIDRKHNIWVIDVR